MVILLNYNNLFNMRGRGGEKRKSLAFHEKIDGEMKKRRGQKKGEIARGRWWRTGGINRNKDKGQWRESKDKK